MDMLMSGMSGSGMDMSSDGMFRDYNQVLAQGFWYIIAAVIGFMLLLRGLDFYQNWARLRLVKTKKSTSYPTKVTNFPMQVYATATAITREMSYPQLHPGGSGWLSGLTPLPLGKVLIIACYWAVVACLMTSQAVVFDAYYWERIGFRNAWISVTQVPLVYLLASKSNVIGFIIGSSHERLNWLHRWVSRTLLVTVTVHGFFFWTEWLRADFIALELGMMPMVKYGLGAWGVLLWTVVSSFFPLRRLWYEFFVLQHIVSAAVFLYLLYVHVPDYAQYNIWFAIAALSFDRVFRWGMLLFRNIRFQTKQQCNGTKRIGHQIELEATCDEITVVTIKDVHFSWTPGQHLYLWIPYLGPLESHPFTIANPFMAPDQCHCNEVQLAIRAQSGFSKRIHRLAMKTQEQKHYTLTGFITGPYGVPPTWSAYESLILISASTGASFTLPILESVLSTRRTVCTQRISFLLVVRNKSHINFYVKRLNAALAKAESRAIDLTVEIAITSEEGGADSLHESEKTEVGDSECCCGAQNQNQDQILEGEKSTLSEKKDLDAIVISKSSMSTKSSRLDDEPSSSCCCSNPAPTSTSTSKPNTQIIYSYTRPQIRDLIRKTVEITGGETSVAVCGGKSLVATVRNSVASLSDERAVHKGTGAQGIGFYGVKISGIITKCYTDYGVYMGGSAFLSEPDSPDSYEVLKRLREFFLQLLGEVSDPIYYDPEYPACEITGRVKELGCPSCEPNSDAQETGEPYNNCTHSTEILSVEHESDPNYGKKMARLKEHLNRRCPGPEVPDERNPPGEEYYSTLFTVQQPDERGLDCTSVPDDVLENLQRVYLQIHADDPHPDMTLWLSFYEFADDAELPPIENPAPPLTKAERTKALSLIPRKKFNEPFNGKESYWNTFKKNLKNTVVECFATNTRDMPENTEKEYRLPSRSQKSFRSVMSDFVAQAEKLFKG
ncbi:hypothetical protein G7Y89_g4425 [Cudoniella acicularis]|uniref:ferric-chelate reductase (NADPH) n=1 Tax=Cudoniella acicularis TaxID=354080 RepID=A0A8H4RQA2_9HELO|nr:hypothetical protein G7Y89_g4425 [Cudoniella acicularis]